MAVSVITGRMAFASRVSPPSHRKTGTAEIDDDVSHAWFACALCDEAQPPFVIVTFIEHGGFSTVARELAVRLVNQYIVEDKGNDQ